MSDSLPPDNTMRQLRVLIVSPMYRSGGAERCARELFEGLRARGDVEPAMLVNRLRGDEPPGVRSPRYRVERWLDYMRVLPGMHDWRHFGSRRVLDRLTTTDFDVVHFHNIVGSGFSVAALARLARRIPTVWTLHDEWAPTSGLAYDLSHFTDPGDRQRCSAEIAFDWDYRATCTRTFLASHLPQPVIVVAPSRYMVSLARDSGRFKTDEFEYLPNALPMLDEPNCSLDATTTRERYGFRPEIPVVLIAAMDLAVAYKGARYGLEALNHYATLCDPNRLPQVLLLTSDDHPANKYLSPALKRKCVHLTTNEELASAYRAADITLIPSLRENFPYVAIESLACRTPIVGTTAGGMAEIIGNNERGIGVEPADAKALALAMSRMLNNAEIIQSMGAAGRAWVEEKCRPECNINRSIAIYRAAIDRFRRSTG